MAEHLSLCFLLTAGLGTRLRPFTETLPKPSLPFLNLPLMNYGFYLAKQAGFENFLFNTHHLPQEIKKSVEALSPMAKSTAISSEDDEILGSAGALWQARSILKDHDYFLVANGDEILIPQNPTVLKSLVEQFKKDEALCTLLTCDHPELLKTLKAVWIDKGGQVQGFGMDQPKEGLSPVHYTGYKVFSKRVLDLIPPGESNIFYDVLKSAIANGSRVTTHHLEHCHWYETGNFNSFLTASQTVATEHPEALSKIHDFFSQKFQLISEGQASQILFPDAKQLPKEVQFSGFNTIGSDVQFAGPATLNNVIVCPGATVPANADLKNTFVF